MTGLLLFLLGGLLTALVLTWWGRVTKGQPMAADLVVLVVILWVFIWILAALDCFDDAVTALPEGEDAHG
ncbi:MAG: hypothetical protein JSS67_03490 [Bacteroidetes bacterium]|nr:hypothetical protein [Bacteroidota bacterium]